jgi:hypothetical protein
MPCVNLPRRHSRRRHSRRRRCHCRHRRRRRRPVKIVHGHEDGRPDAADSAVVSDPSGPGSASEMRDGVRVSLLRGLITSTQDPLRHASVATAVIIRTITSETPATPSAALISKDYAG